MTAPYGLLNFGGEQPSAITSLLQQMTQPNVPPPGMTPSAPPMPPPQAAQLPAMKPAERPHMLHRIADLLGSLGSGVGGAVADTVKGIGNTNAPAGYEGFLTPEEMQGAKQSRLHNILFALGGGNPQAEYQGSLNNIIGMHGFASQQAAAKQSEVEKQKMLATRAEIGKRFQVPPNATPQQQVQGLMQMYTAYSQAGDVEMAGKLGEVLKSMGNVLDGPKVNPLADDLEWVDMGGEKALVRKSTGVEVRREKKTPSPRDPNAPDTAAQLRDQRMFQREQQLGDDYNKDTKTYRELNQKLRGAVNEMPAALNGDGAAQTNMLYAFVSAMDPASAVREGEIGLVQSAAPLRARVNQILQKYLETGKSALVPKEMVQAMGDLMKRRMDLTQDYVKERSDYYGTRAKKWGVSSDMFPGVDGQGTVKATTPAAAPAAKGGGKTITVNGKTFKVPD